MTTVSADNSPKTDASRAEYLLRALERALAGSDKHAAQAASTIALELSENARSLTLERLLEKWQSKKWVKHLGNPSGRDTALQAGVFVFAMLSLTSWMGLHDLLVQPAATADPFAPIVSGVVVLLGLVSAPLLLATAAGAFMGRPQDDRAQKLLRLLSDKEGRTEAAMLLESICQGAREHAAAVRDRDMELRELDLRVMAKFAEAERKVLSRALDNAS